MGNYKNLFVYGTLKEGGSLHKSWLKDQTFMGTYYTEPNYFLFDYGPFPIVFAVPKGTGQIIEGEIYEVNESNFSTIKTMEEGAGYEVNKIFFSQKGEQSIVWLQFFLTLLSILNMKERLKKEL